MMVNSVYIIISVVFVLVFPSYISDAFVTTTYTPTTSAINIRSTPLCSTKKDDSSDDFISDFCIGQILFGEI